METKWCTRASPSRWDCLPWLRPGKEGKSMGAYEFDLWVFMLAAFLGFQLIRGVSPLLHTPLMSLTNAISAITVVGAILITGAQGASTLSRILGFSAVLLASLNVVSGFLITDRMLKMFKKREPEKK